MNHPITGRGKAPTAPRVGTRALTLASSLLLAAGAASAQDASPPHTTWLDTITVTGTRTETSVMHNPASVSVVGQDQLERQAPESIADLVRDVPGVEVVDASAPGMKRLRIRGESSHRVTILVDGQEITDHSDYGTPILVDPANVERIDVIRGPASVLYGAKAIGGVVNIITKRGAPRPIQLETGTSYYSGTRGWQGWAAVSGTVGDFDYRLSGSADRHHDRAVPNGRYTQDGRLDGSSYRDSDLALHLGYTFGTHRNHYLALKAEQHILSTDSWTDPGYLQGPIRDFRIELPKRDLRKIGLYYDARDLSPVVRKIHVDAYRQTVDRLFENRVEVQPVFFMNVKNTATSDDRNLNYGGTAQVDLALHPDHYTIVGAQYLMDDLDTRKNSITTTRRTIPFPSTTVKRHPTHTRASIQTASLYAQDAWSFAQDFKLTAGLRYYHVRSSLDETTNTALAGQGDRTTGRLVKSLGLTWNGLAHTTLRALYSEGYTTPTLMQLYSDTTAGSGSPTRANPDLKPETSQNYELGARYQHAGVVLDAAVFYTQAKDYISTTSCVSAGTCPPGHAASDRTYINADRADTHGIELAAEYALPGTGFTPYVSGAWTRRELKYARYSTRDSGVPAFSGRTGVRYDTTLYGADVWADLFVRAATAIRQAENATHSERLPGWGTLNLAFGGTHGKDRKVQVSVQFNNILDKEYRSAFDSLPGTGRNVEVTLRTTF
ncbi:MAG: TonB-dependent receptor [Castellaniella sp.]|uniref:TonB-dependent receptor plug domain-containing protein n=1 Tax=Castellaniella sp. TaxID=1955812 RepID=UPI002A36EB90|nr:TonB-dependent receptor [Castellaniella sp.]MDY0308300.1 TonB-dependent receptor [Castellaniella sp.]